MLDADPSGRNQVRQALPLALADRHVPGCVSGYPRPTSPFEPRRFFRSEQRGNGELYTDGLGLLVMTGMAVTGSAYFFLSGTLAHTALSLHSLMANLVWAYLYR